MKSKLFKGYLILYFILVVIYVVYNSTVFDDDLAIDNHLYYSSVIMFLFMCCLKTKIELFTYIKKSTEQFQVFFFQCLAIRNQITLAIILNIFLSRIFKFRIELLFTNFRNSKYISQFKKGHAPPRIK
ncbi:hypothetical protein S100390_v1c10110 [Spiroplasma sp. NBRC 100390]|uniref:hypothetical protein n=1 Tax=unclassified Spiroplasma TaxID=2637901 RepID=UPI00089284B1|nr:MULTISPECIES: hypothetical protein [unclassified Spiroplasma]AOX44347.1 hypothetical protein STU14_v1c10110 [Spiroplasma sp. TU-14]APE13817.1 hypothetical protein S100390_v1c10110 [Spiroplasma sp. NBRC 100390]